MIPSVILQESTTIPIECLTESTTPEPSSSTISGTKTTTAAPTKLSTTLKVTTVTPTTKKPITPAPTAAPNTTSTPVPTSASGRKRRAVQCPPPSRC